MKTKYQRILDIQFQSKDCVRKLYNKGIPLFQRKTNNCQASQSFQNNRKQRWNENNILRDTNNIKRQIIEEARIKKNEDQTKHLQRNRQIITSLVSKSDKQNVRFFKVDTLGDAGQTIRKKYSKSISSSKSTSHLNSRKLCEVNRKQWRQKTNCLRDNRIMNIDALNQKIYRILQEKNKNTINNQCKHQTFQQQDSLQIQRHTQLHQRTVKHMKDCQMQQYDNIVNKRSQSHQRLELNNFQQESYTIKSINQMIINCPNHFNMTFQRPGFLLKEKCLQNTSQYNKQDGQQQIETPKTFIQHGDVENQLSFNAYSNRLSQINQLTTKIINRDEKQSQNIRNFDSNVYDWKKYDQQILEMESKMREFKIWKQNNNLYEEWQNCKLEQTGQNNHQRHTNQYQHISYEQRQLRSQKKQQTTKQIFNKKQTQSQQQNRKSHIGIIDRNSVHNTPKTIYKRLSTQQTQFRLQFQQGIGVQLRQKHKSRLLKSLEHQIKLDGQFIKQKLWFKQRRQNNKWDLLFNILSQRDQEIPFMEKNEIIQTFNIQRSESKSLKTLIQSSSINQLVQAFIRSERYWSSKILHRFSNQQLQRSQLSKIANSEHSNLFQLGQFQRIFQNEYQLQELELILKRLKATKGGFLMKDRLLQMFRS